MDILLLIEALEKSIKKNGKDYVLTLGHLLAILKKIEQEAQGTCDATELDIY
jgi:hypothetical protein